MFVPILYWAPNILVFVAKNGLKAFPHISPGKSIDVS